MLSSQGKRSRFSSLVQALCLVLWLLPAMCTAEPYVWPSWRAETADGSEFHSRRLDGKVVVMTMWASWCPSCRKQLPIMDNLRRLYRDEDVELLSFSFDHSKSTLEKYVKDESLKLPSIFARSGEGLKVVKMLQKGTGTLEAVPTVLIYDKRGRLAHNLVGFFNRRELEDLISPLLKE